MERVFSLYPDTFQFGMPDPLHNLRSVRSAVFWYWLFLNERLVNKGNLSYPKRQKQHFIISHKEGFKPKGLKEQRHNVNGNRTGGLFTKCSEGASTRRCNCND